MSGQEKGNKYGYRHFSFILDPEDELDKEIIDWIMENKSRKNKFNDIFKRAIRKLMEEEV